MAVLADVLIPLACLACALAALAAACWVAWRRVERGAGTLPAASALSMTAGWALVTLAAGPEHVAAAAFLTLSTLGWLWVLLRLFSRGQAVAEVKAGPVRLAVLALALVEISALAMVLTAAMPNLAITLRLLFCVGALVLVHNLYASASGGARNMQRWAVAALAVMWLYDLNVWTVAYLNGSTLDLLLGLRGAVMLLVTGLFAFGLTRHERSPRLRPSRAFAFQSFSLVAIGAYLLAMVLVEEALSWAGTDWARAVQAGFGVAAIALAAIVLPSARLRGWLRVTLSKHLFQHRYDYRAEWLRFADTIGRGGPDEPPLRERVVRAVADVTDSPAGLLLVPEDQGRGLMLSARWQWPAPGVPVQAMEECAARFFEEGGFIVDLDDVRNGRAGAVPATACPQWLLASAEAWAMVPLLHYGRLAGVVVLARPPFDRRLDWQDFDLLRVVGRQLASYLVEQASRDALDEARHFDEFNRRIAFVMHDIKNLSSQLTLLARNAQRHADNPDFRADMLLTLRSSAEKLQALLSRLGRYGAQGGGERQEVAIRPVLARAARQCGGDQRVVVAEGPAAAAVLADPDALEQALVHLIQNAVDASPPAQPVLIDWREDGAEVMVEIVDRGAGMSAEFIRTGLFRPFHSSKNGGFGIGAYEARELVRAMGGRIEVESREGAGSRFRIVLPRGRADAADRAFEQGRSEVA